MLKRHRLLFFYLFALILSWYPCIIAIAKGTTTGPNPLGVFLAAILISALTEGRKAVADLFRRIVRWRVGIQWYAVVILLPVAISFAAAGISWLFGAPLPASEKWQGWRELPERFLFIFLFIGLGEEPGWRGYMLEKLQIRRSALNATMILAPLWAIWHLPLIGNEFPPSLVPQFLIALFAATVLSTWIYNRTRGSILLPMMFHATVNSIGAGFLFPMFSGVDLMRLWWIQSILWLLVSLVILKWNGMERYQEKAETAEYPARASFSPVRS